MKAADIDRLFGAIVQLRTWKYAVVDERSTFQRGGQTLYQVRIATTTNEGDLGWVEATVRSGQIMRPVVQTEFDAWCQQDRLRVIASAKRQALRVELTKIATEYRKVAYHVEHIYLMPTEQELVEHDIALPEDHDELVALYIKMTPSEYEELCLRRKLRGVDPTQLKPRYG